MRNLSFILIFILGFCTGNIYAQKDESLGFIGVNRGVGYYNTDRYYSLLGYKVVFPDHLEPDFSLDHCLLGIGLAQKVSRETQQALEANMRTAIEDNVTFHKLDDYHPYRSGGGFYLNNTKSIKLVVSSMPADIFKIVEYSVLIQREKSKMHTFRKGKFKYIFVDRTGEKIPSALYWDSGKITFGILVLNGILPESDMVHFAEQINFVNRSK